ncbi:hypothetical protein GCM10009675_05250 [Prauserella alba]|uniref:Uncharacterized protein n=1 Tax=Prauserella alba TaxID=176898 RepID=A0ABP4FRE0_9PSEU
MPTPVSAVAATRVTTAFGRVADMSLILPGLPDIPDVGPPLRGNVTSETDVSSVANGDAVVVMAQFCSE